jgi:hypothetical protein
VPAHVAAERAQTQRGRGLDRAGRSFIPIEAEYLAIDRFRLDRGRSTGERVPSIRRQAAAGLDGFVQIGKLWMRDVTAAASGIGLQIDIREIGEPSIATRMWQYRGLYRLIHTLHGG